MARTSQDEADEQRSNEGLQGDHHKRAQRSDSHVSESDREGKAGPAPDDARGGRQQGGAKGH